MTRLIEVEKVETYAEGRQAYPSSVALVTGRVIGSPERVTFVADARTAHDLRLTLATAPGMLLVAQVEDWQIMGGLN